MKSFLVIALLLVAGCATAEPADPAEFRKLCEANGHMWMRMVPEESDVMCDGCMEWGGPHLCTMDAYKDYLEQGTETMQVAHAGMAGQVAMGDMTVVFNQPTARAGQETALAWTVLKGGKTVTDLALVHEKPMHVILVRDDLKHFAHVHPELKDGTWMVPFTFNAGGTYRIWVEFTKGTMHLVDFDLDVEGADVPEQKTSGVLFTPPDIHVGELAQLRFVTDAPVSEQYLGEDAHVIAIDESRASFVHNHDSSVRGDNVLVVNQKFSTPGTHRLWLQFMAEGELKTVWFDVDVQEQSMDAGMDEMR